MSTTDNFKVAAKHALETLQQIESTLKLLNNLFLTTLHNDLKSTIEDETTEYHLDKEWYEFTYNIIDSVLQISETRYYSVNDCLRKMLSACEIMKSALNQND